MNHRCIFLRPFEKERGAKRKVKKRKNLVNGEEGGGGGVPTNAFKRRTYPKVVANLTYLQKSLGAGGELLERNGEREKKNH